MGSGDLTWYYFVMTLVDPEEDIGGIRAAEHDADLIRKEHAEHRM